MRVLLAAWLLLGVTCVAPEKTSPSYEEKIEKLIIEIDCIVLDKEFGMCKPGADKAMAEYKKELHDLGVEYEYKLR
jgi:hypothetical protein